jgi:hypothetical protein
MKDVGSIMALAADKLEVQRSEEGMLETMHRDFYTVMKDVDNTMKFDDDYKDPWIPDTCLENMIMDVILAAANNTPGVAVILAPEGSGKSTRVRERAKFCVQHNILRGATYFPMDGISKSQSIFKAYTKYLSLKAHEHHTWKQLIPKRKNVNESTTSKVLLIFDQVERAKEHPDFDDCFTDLAIASHNNNPEVSFVVIALCCESNTAERLLLMNGNSKFYAPIEGDCLLNMVKFDVTVQDARLRPNQGNYAFCGRFTIEAKKSGICTNAYEALGENLLRILNLVRIAGTVGFCRNAAKKVVECIVSKNNLENVIKTLTDNAQSTYDKWIDHRDFATRAASIRKKRNRELISV